MDILLFGADGQVGRALQRSLAPMGNVTALARDDTHHAADFDHPAALATTVRALRPQVVVNAAAWTAVDLAEAQPETAHRVNAEAVGVLAREAAAAGAWLVHYSSDYVFDGSGHTPWKEGCATAPLNAYGASKLAGEELLRASGCQHLLLRTAWVYAARGRNFVNTVREGLLRGELLSVVDDQIGAPTPAALVAELTAALLLRAVAEPTLAGTYHLAAAGETSWHGVASFIADTLRTQGHKVLAPQPVYSAQVLQQAVRPAIQRAIQQARRPLNSRLDTTKLRATLGVDMPAWQEALARVLAAWPAP